MTARPRLSRDVVRASAAAVGVTMPPAAVLDLPERVIQFGTGALLRGLVDVFIDDANARGAFGGRVVAISSTGSGRDDALNAQHGLYTVVSRGLVNGAPSQNRRVIASISRALSATEEWDDVLAVARDPNITTIFSNTTEVGIALDDGDNGLTPPRSFPGKLTRLLYERATAFDFDRSRGVVVLPCELIENNGKLLGEIVHTLAERWELGARFTRWLGDAVEFRDTLVDRIVTGAPSPEEALRLAEELGYDDAMTTVCEPYRLLAIDGDDGLRCRLGFADGADGIVVTSDIGPYRERKVRILNGGHTATVSVALLAGLDTVRAAMADERVGRFMRHTVFEEIVPSLNVPGGEAFAASVIDRFGNPFVDHALVDITLQGTAKMRARIVPSVVAFHRRFGRVPPSLAFGFAAYLLTMRGDSREARRAAGQRVPFDSLAETLAAHWRNVGSLSLGALVSTVVADVLLWGGALREVDGFGALVTEHLVRLDQQGIHAALDAHLAAAQAAP